MPDNDPTFDPSGRPVTPPTVPVPPYDAPPGYQQPSGIYPAAPPQQVVYQQVPVPVPVQSPPSQVATRPVDAAPAEVEIHHPQYVVVSHSNLFYWWPVWVVGYLMTIFTWSYGETIVLGDASLRIHASNNMGVLFLLTLFMVIMITNIAVRGLASLVVILLLTLAAVLMAYFRV